jgi:D-beta-D-heptose 7-phosphate kinase/D-beta-D-heptose 1-phosphate adenosyltransferase
MKKVLVIGDSCIDEFRYGNCDRLCPEAPVPVFKTISGKRNYGMALNVYNNLKALGIECDIITNDIKPTKTRYVDEVSNQMLLRVDINDSVEAIDDDILNNIDYDSYEAIIISDYDKGYLNIHDIMHISDNHPSIFMDSKKELGGWCDDIKYIKINEKEADRSHDYLTTGYKNNLIITSGNKGARLRFERFPIETEHAIRDLSGAGDTFIAALVAEFIKSNDIRSAIAFANRCAAWVVSQKGVVVVDTNKI